MSATDDLLANNTRYAESFSGPLPLPPAKMPLRFAGTWRKRWRYVGAFGEQVMLCAATVRIGPFGQTFWAILDRR